MSAQGQLSLVDTRRRYDRTGLLAIDPQAFGWLFDPPEASAVQMLGGVAVVDVRGPLDHHAGWWCDNYDAITARVKDACASEAVAVVLRLDSPGGAVSGCFEAAREIRAACSFASKPLVAFVEGAACSAAYALAVAADRIVVPRTGMVGSVGVMCSRLDVSELDAKLGTRVAVVTSGARKADGHPNVPLTAEELAALQGTIDGLASVFFDWVSERRGLKPGAVKALEAGVFHGVQAVNVGLADSVETFAELLSALEKGDAMTNPKATKIDEARTALEEAAEGEGDEAEKAKRALKAMDEAGDDDEGDESAEGEGDEAGDDDEGDEAAAASGVSTSTAADLATTVARQGAELAQLRAQNQDAARAAIFAARPDIPHALRKVLANKPVAEVRAIVNAIERKAVKPAASAVVPATRGEGQGAGDASRLPPEEKAALDEAMGLRVTLSTGVIKSATSLVLGAPVPVSASK